MTHILVATDLSHRSERAVRRAYKIAAAQQATLTVASVIDSDLPLELAHKMRDETVENLRRFCASVSDYPVDIRVDIGDPLRSIHSLARDLAVDLIVLGVHRDRAWGDLWGGTTMERLVRGTTRPVLLVRDPVDHAYARAVCGLDFSPSCSAALDAVSALAPDAKVETFHAVHVPFAGFLAPDASTAQTDPFVKEAEGRLAAWLDTATLPENCAAPQVIVGGVQEALRKIISADRPDLIVVGAHGRANIAQSYLGSFTEALIRNPPSDILVVRR